MIPKRIQNSIAFNTLLLLAAVFLSIAAYRSVKQAFQFKEETDENKAKISELLEKKNELEMKIAEFKTLDAKERSAKERLNLKKPGEEVVIVLPEETKDSTPPKDKNLMDKIKSFWE